MKVHNVHACINNKLAIGRFKDFWGQQKWNKCLANCVGLFYILWIPFFADDYGSL